MFAAAEGFSFILPSFDFRNFDCEGLCTVGRPAAEPNAVMLFIENCFERISWLAYPAVCRVYVVSPSAPPERLKAELGLGSGLPFLLSSCRYHCPLELISL
jgi:hypothetical protein